MMKGLMIMRRINGNKKRRVSSYGCTITQSQETLPQVLAIQSLSVGVYIYDVRHQ